MHFFRQTPVFVLGEEALLFVPVEERTRVAIHAGGILASAARRQRIVTGGDDGKLVADQRDGEHESSPPTTRSAGSIRSRWPGRRGGLVGRQDAHVRTGKGEVRDLELPSTVAALAFAPKGFRLAIAHYNGATLWFPNAAAKPDVLEWKGSHLGVTVQPGRQIPDHHDAGADAARLAHCRRQAHAHVRLFGARALALLDADGKSLATSGSEQLILWPFDGKDGPMGKQPNMLAQSPARVRRSPVIRAARRGGGL